MTVGNHNFKRLVEHLRPLSVANETGDLLAEWQPLASYQSETADRCPCGHHPIYEICHIRNRLNGEHTFVGNVCVRHFSTVRVDLIAANQKRIRRDRDAALMADAIEHYHALGFLTEWERGFALNTQHKRRLSDRQALHRRRINNKVMRQAGIAERLRRLQLAEAADE